MSFDVVAPRAQARTLIQQITEQPYLWSKLGAPQKLSLPITQNINKWNWQKFQEFIFQHKIWVPTKSELHKLGP